ncbi:glycosyltransferase family 2 protein [Lactococcus petauri]|uniref:glycosyltransferase family 2 protein n=1 Tax=Lactococcus petauri TaxID=1940789 RepID=UPI0013FE2CF9
MAFLFIYFENKEVFDISVIIPTWSIFKKKFGDKLAIEIGWETLLAQQDDRFKFEIIFVDDLSPDGTADWLKSWIENHPEVETKLIVRKENSGTPSAPRNNGMAVARGKYIAFMDNDDQFGAKGSFYELFEHAEKWNSDHIIGRVDRRSLELGDIQYQSFKKVKGSFARVNIEEVDFAVRVNIWSNLYRREFIEENNIKFPEPNGYYEDVNFTAQVLAKTQKISFLNKQAYYYWVIDGEHLQSASSLGIQKMKFKQLLDSMKHFEKSEYKYSHGAAYLSRLMSSAAFRTIYSDVDDRQIFLMHSKMHEQWRDFFKNSEYKSYLQKNDQIIFEISMVEDYQLSRDLYHAYKQTLEASLFIKLSPKLITTDRHSNLLKQAALIEYQSGKLMLDRLSLSFNHEAQCLDITNPTVHLNSLLLIIASKDQKNYIAVPFSSKVNIDLEPIRDFLTKNRLSDIFVGIESDNGIIGKMIEADIPSERYTFSNGKTAEIYTNFKKGPSIRIR